MGNIIGKILTAWLGILVNNKKVLEENKEFLRHIEKAIGYNKQLIELNKKVLEYNEKIYKKIPEDAESGSEEDIKNIVRSKEILEKDKDRLEYENAELMRKHRRLEAR